jgi:hypothetical protein
LLQFGDETTEVGACPNAENSDTSLFQNGGIFFGFPCIMGLPIGEDNNEIFRVRSVDAIPCEYL